MDAKAIARFTAACRVGFGVAFLSRPQFWMRPWIGRDADRPGARVLARALGARDLVLGLGTLAAPEGEPLRRWLAASLVADATDLVVTLAERERLPAPGVVAITAIAGGAVVLGGVAIGSESGRRMT